MISLHSISIKYVGYLFVAFFCMSLIFNAIYFEPHDFANYYFGASFLKEGKFSYQLYFPHIFNQQIETLGYKDIFSSYAPNTPFLALFFLPFALLSLIQAKIVFNIISLLLFLYSLQKLFGLYKIKHYYLFLIPVVFFIPLRNNFLFGQIYLLLFFLLTEGFLALKKESYLKMGLFWGIAIMLKVFPFILFGLLLFKKQYKALITLGLCCFFLLIISISINGIEVWEFYFKSVIIRSGNGEISRELVVGYQSIFMFLKQLFLSQDQLFSFLLLLIKLCLIVISYFFTKYETSDLKVFSFWIFLSILLSPYGSTYTSLLLIFLFIYYTKKQTSKYRKWFIIFLFLLISNIPLSYFVLLPPPFCFPKLMASIALFIILAAGSFSYIQWKPSFLFISTLLIISLFMNKNPLENSTVLIKNQPILTYDYTIHQDTLQYIYRNQKGQQIKSTDILVKTIDTNSLAIHNNQIYYKGKQMTFGNDNKHNPSIINKNQLIYLSDLKKGIGFYQLRSISLISK